MNQSWNNPHDKFFKEAFHHTEVVRSFVETYLQPRIEFRVNLDNLQLFQYESIHSSVEAELTGIIYKTETIPQKEPIYLLFEYKETPDNLIGWDIWEYGYMIAGRRSRSNDSNGFYLIPIVFYTGERNWSPPSDDELERISKYAMLFKFELFNIIHLPDDQIRGPVLLSP